MTSSGATRPREPLRFAQITVANWHDDDGRLHYSTLALGIDGRVYRYDAACNGWVAWSDRLATCEGRHKR